MKLKLKPDMFLMCDRFSNYSFQEFSDKIGHFTNKQIRNIYKEVFGRDCTCDPVWAKYQIQYELARQNDIKAGKLSRLYRGTAFRKAYEGTMRCDLSRTSETLKTLIPFEQKCNNMKKQENKTTAIKKAVEAKKSKCIGITLGLSVYDTWVSVFQKNETAHKTDEEITAFMLSEFPDHQIKSFYNVHACRGYYNQGRFTKGVKPEIKSVRYNEAGQPIGRGAVKPAPVAKISAPKANKANLAPVKKAVTAAKPKKTKVVIKKSAKAKAK